MTTRGARSRHGLVIDAGKKGKAQTVAKTKTNGDADVRAIIKSRAAAIGAAVTEISRSASSAARDRVFPAAKGLSRGDSPSNPSSHVLRSALASHVSRAGKLQPAPSWKADRKTESGKEVAKKKIEGNQQSTVWSASPRRLVFLREKFDLPAKQDAAAVIQLHYRRHLGRKARQKLLQDQTKAAVVIQATIRGFLVRSALNEASECAILLQSAWRRHQARKTVNELRGAQKEAAAAKASEQRRKQSEAVDIISKRYRLYRAKKRDEKFQRESKTPEESERIPTTPRTSVSEEGTSLLGVDADAAVEADLVPTDNTPTQDTDAQSSDSVRTESTERAQNEGQDQDTENAVASVVDTENVQLELVMCDHCTNTVVASLVTRASDVEMGILTGNATPNRVEETNQFESISRGSTQDLTIHEAEQDATTANNDGVAIEKSEISEVRSLEESLDGCCGQNEEPRIDELCTRDNEIFSTPDDSKDGVSGGDVPQERKDSNPVRTYGITYTVVTSTTLPAKESSSDDESGASSVDARREARIEAATRAQAAMGFKGPGMDVASDVDVTQCDRKSASTETPLPKYMSPRMQKRQMRQMQTQEHFVAARQDDLDRPSISTVEGSALSKKPTEKPNMTSDEELQAHFSVESDASATNEGALMQPSRIRR